MIKAIIFDCFGVLLTDPLEPMLHELLSDSPDKAERVTETVVAASRGLIEPRVSTATLADLFGLTVDEFNTRIREGEIKNTPLFELIGVLRGRYKIGLLSNVRKGGLRPRFSDDELAQFDAVIASGDIGYAKPEAQAYEIMADKLGVRLVECIMVDDREQYCYGAQVVGMKAIQYQSFEQMKSKLAGYVTLPA